VTQEFTAQAERLQEAEKENILGSKGNTDEPMETRPGARRRAAEA